MQQPKVGDTVIFKAIVQSIDSDSTCKTMKIKFIDCQSPGVFGAPICVTSLSEVIPAPASPKVGDRVHVKARDTRYAASNPNIISTLLYIHQEAGDDRKWGVISYYGDKPRCVYFADLSVAD